MNAPTVLPSVMQQRLQTLRAEEQTTNAPATNEQPNVEQPNNEQQNHDRVDTSKQQVAEGERVTLSREEYNELRANSGQAETLRGRQETAELELEELRHRLTELQNNNKGGSNASDPAPAPAPVIDASTIQFTEDEEEQYGETREFIEKVVDLRVAHTLNKLVPELRSAIDEAKKTATTVAGEVQKTNQRTFHARLTEKVPELQKYIKHPQWAAFLDETDPLSGFTYEQLIANNVSQQNVERTAKIYDHFASKYVKPLTPNAAYAGSGAGGGAVNDTGDSDQATKMKFSDRKKASEDYKKGRITYEQLQEVTKKFEAAIKAGNVDYDS